MTALLYRDMDDTSPRAADHAVRLARYGAAWETYGAALAKAVARGTTLKQIIADQNRLDDTYNGFVMAQVAEQVARVDLGTFAGQPEPFRLVVRDGRYASLPTAPSRAALFKLIAGCVDDEVDCIVEFGSGLGINLARLRALRPDADLTYIACEPTASGRQAARLVFQSDPHARLEVHEFDYADADLSFLDRFRRVVAFTSHSVEQVPVLGQAFYRRLLATKIAYCIHIEPVGWQRFTDIASFVGSAHLDGAARQHCATEYRFVVDDARLVDNAAIWSALCRYNTDLLALISAAASRGEVKLFALAYDVVGLNPFNPSTLVAWKR